MQNHSTSETPGGTTDYLDPGDRDDADYRLRLFVWGYQANVDPRIEYFGPREYDKAIDRARELSTSPERISRLQVVDAWGMLIVQFTHRQIIVGLGRKLQ